MKTRTKIKTLAALVLLLLAGAAVWYWFCGGVSHRELKDSVEAESAAVQRKIDARYEALDRKLDAMDAKLDKMLRLLNPPLPDGLRRAE